ncbi:hypothetical protein IEQ34_007515 [Dendrobium chrysotoxum]|uniref:Uncharacterized protein n=1 Tax=Dendrobium chrysotoxum TaxID=161865 RepID=A0AAV7H5K4_DENCH|nr:hypothetical protein IEQ34_007515 [Dendrobium chrysotoxum]
MNRWVPTEGDSTDPLQMELYKLQSKIHKCTEQYMKNKKLLQEQFKQEQDEILKKYATKIQELDALLPSPRIKSKDNSSGDEFFNLLWWSVAFPFPLAASSVSPLNPSILVVCAVSHEICWASCACCLGCWFAPSVPSRLGWFRGFLAGFLCLFLRFPVCLFGSLTGLFRGCFLCRILGLLFGTFGLLLLWWSVAFPFPLAASSVSPLNPSVLVVFAVSHEICWASCACCLGCWFAPSIPSRLGWFRGFLAGFLCLFLRFPVCLFGSLTGLFRGCFLGCSVTVFWLFRGCFLGCSVAIFWLFRDKYQLWYKNKVIIQAGNMGFSELENVWPLRSCKQSSSSKPSNLNIASFSVTFAVNIATDPIRGMTKIIHSFAFILLLLLLPNVIQDKSKRNVGKKKRSKQTNVPVADAMSNLPRGEASRRKWRSSTRLHTDGKDCAKKGHKGLFGSWI